MDAGVFVEEARTAARKRREEVEEKACVQTAEHIFARIAKLLSTLSRLAG